jgi:hypothetical protein
LKFTTSVAHYIVDDDSDHADAHDHSRAPGQAQVQNQDDRAGSGLTEDKQIADLSGPDKDLSHVVIDAMDEYQNIDQHQVDKVFEQVADVIRKAASVSIGCKISKGRGTAAWWTQYAVIRSETQEAYEAAMHSKLYWELCDCASRRTKR